MVRAMDAMCIKPNAMDGSTRLLIPWSAPDTGNQPSFTEKNRISRRPIQNTGIEIPRRDMNMLMPSNSVFCLMAAMIPNGSASKMATTVDVSAKTAVFGRRAHTSSPTGSRVL